MKTKNVAVLTSGGDSPGMNTAIISLFKYLKKNNINLYFVFEGYQGLFENKIERINKIKNDELIFNTGGTFIKTSRFLKFKKLDIREKCKENLQNKNIDYLVVIGGNGSYEGAKLLSQIDVNVVCIPGTIDNDIDSANVTIGFNTSLNTIVHNVNRIKSTMSSHNRGAIIEVMGRGCDDLAIYSALVTNAIVSTNQSKLSIQQISQCILEQQKNNKTPLLIVSEYTYEDIEKICQQVFEKTSIELKPVILSYLQRGGMPTTNELIIASQYGIYAAKAIIEQQKNIEIVYKNEKFEYKKLNNNSQTKLKNKKNSFLSKVINEINSF